MRKSASGIMIASSALALLSASLVIVPGTASAADATVLEQGKQIAFDRKKGNCLACHKIDDGTFPGNIGPALVNMQARFPEKSALRNQVWDATKANPNTIMPPFGKHRILTEVEIDKVVEYIYSL